MIALSKGRVINAPVALQSGDWMPGAMRKRNKQKQSGVSRKHLARILVRQESELDEP